MHVTVVTCDTLIRVHVDGFMHLATQKDNYCHMSLCANACHSGWTIEPSAESVMVSAESVMV